MAISKPRGSRGARQIFVYDPGRKRKVYVGSREKLSDARVLFREKTKEFAQAAADGAPAGVTTMQAFASRWLEDFHGKGTSRPQRSTWELNRQNLRPFLEDYGDRAVDGGISRSEALSWARKHAHQAKTVSAMLNDAVDVEEASGNPFANRRQPQGRERKHIHPLTEEEVDRLARIALEHWGAEGYGLTARAFVLFGAWVGTRPGETFSVELRDMDIPAGLVTVRRIKKRGGVHPTDTIVLPRVVSQAVQAIPDLPRVGPVFLTVQGTRFVKGSLRYYFDPIRAAFRATVTAERWAELLDGSEDGKRLDFYSLRHFCASQIVERGGNEYDVAAQLGNSPEVAREVYIHAYKEQARERVRRFLDGAEVKHLRPVEDTA